MPKVTGPDGVEREISNEEFMEALASEDAKVIGMQQVIRDNLTGEIVQTFDIPVNEDGSFDLFGGGLFGSLFGDNRSLEEKITDAEDGDEDTMRELANLYLNGDDEVDSDPEKAVYWFTKLAELNDSDAQFNLGLHYAKGHGVDRDFTKAIYWMERAAENGDGDAPALIEKYKKAAAAMEKLPSGDAQAQADLAGVLMALAGSLNQAGVGKDYEEAFVLAQKSASQNNGDGLWALALAYEHGRGVEQDVQKAIECYRKGAQLGHAPSQHSLGCYYMRGDVLEEDKELAVELCRKSAEQGYALAEFFMAKVYETGDGVEEDLDQALAWGEKAAEHGTRDIQYEVAKLYTYTGEDGKMINPERARYWLAKAAERGHEMAYQMLNFPPMWAEEDVEMDDDFDEEESEGEDDGTPDWMEAMMQLTNIALENGIEEAMGGAEPSLDDAVAFVQKLADNGNEDAAAALEDFFAAIENMEN